MRNIKVLVSIDSGSNPDLYKELMRIPVRSRAGRLRTLATVGITHNSNSTDMRLIQVRKDLSESVDEVNRQEQQLSGSLFTETEEEKTRNDRAMRIINKLSKSL